MKELCLTSETREVCRVIFSRLDAETLVRELGGNVFLFTDEVVARLYSEWLEKALHTKIGYTMSAGEAHKDAQTLLSLLSEMAKKGCDRNTVLVAFGGGVVCDLGGLAASLYMRGIDCVFIPTSLLCDVDACIGGKTAIDFCGVKNLLGSIRLPRAVFIDPVFLRTLPRVELICGLGEIVKHAALCPSLFQKLCAQDDLFDLDFLSSLLPENVVFKAGIVERDLKDKGQRQCLNLGHTTAHALELSEGGLSHGACVLCGIVFEAELAKKYLACDADYLDCLESLCRRILPISLEGLDVAKAAHLARMDKKNAGEKISCIVPTKRGEWARLELAPKQYEEDLLAIRSRL